jgi:hypothetical protein
MGFLVRAVHGSHMFFSALPFQPSLRTPVLVESDLHTASVQFFKNFERPDDLIAFTMTYVCLERTTIHLRGIANRDSLSLKIVNQRNPLGPNPAVATIFRVTSAELR